MADSRQFNSPASFCLTATGGSVSKFTGVDRVVQQPGPLATPTTCSDGGAEMELKSGYAPSWFMGAVARRSVVGWDGCSMTPGVEPAGMVCRSPESPRLPNSAENPRAAGGAVRSWAPTM